MKTNKLMLWVLGFVLLFTFAAASAADAPKLTFKFTKANVRGALQTEPNGINNKGVIVGGYEDKKSVFHGYILDGKKLTTLDDPNGTDTDALGINYNGSIAVVGVYTNSSGNGVGFLYNAKTKQFTDITGPQGATYSGASEINDQGWIVGWYQDSSGFTHGFLLQGKKYTTLDVPGATYTYAYGISNKGNIDLTWVNSHGSYEGALYNYKTKTYKTIKVPRVGLDGSEASYINNEDDITFYWYDSSGLVHGALCTECDSKGRTYYKFNYPKAVETYPNGINDSNTFVGWYQTKRYGPYSGFKATYK